MQSCQQEKGRPVPYYKVPELERDLVGWRKTKKKNEDGSKEPARNYIEKERERASVKVAEIHGRAKYGDRKSLKIRGRRFW